MSDITDTKNSGGGSSGGGFDIGGAIGAAGDLFKGVGGFLGSKGQQAGLQGEAAGFDAEAQGLFEAANLEAYNAAWAGASGDIQIAQQLRTNYKVASQVQQQEGSAGFNGGGSGGDIMRENAQQGAMATQLLGVQKAINVNTYKIQQTMYNAQGKQALDAAQAARDQASSAGTGGILGGIGGVLGAVSKLAPIAMAFL